MDEMKHEQGGGGGDGIPRDACVPCAWYPLETVWLSKGQKAVGINDAESMVQV